MDKKKNNPITSWSLDDRPREKLLLKGKEALTDGELIGILLGSGNREMTAVDLANSILKDADNSLNNLGKWEVDDLMRYKGIGEAKAITIISALEIGRRRLLEKGSEKIKITHSRQLYNYLHPILGDLNHEVFYVLLLNRANIIMKRIKISSGGISGTVVDQRLIFKPAIQHLASSIVVAHNHPSGNLKASRADIQITEKIMKTGEFLDIKLLDHIIITQSGYMSFKDEGLI